MYNKGVWKDFFRFKKGQVTVFIIVAVLVVAGLVLFFVLSSDSGDSQEVSGDQDVQSPSAFLDSCMEDDVRSSLALIRRKGGYLVEEPSRTLDFKFEEENEPRKISYLCYSEGHYSACVNKEPALISHIEEEMNKRLGPTAEDCWSSFIGSVDDGTSVDESYEGIQTDISREEITVSFNSSASIERSNSTTRVENPSMDFSSNLYKTIIVVQDILNAEASNCDFPYREHNLLYPDYMVDGSIKTSDGSEIYRVSSPDFAGDFIFAVRGCVT